MKKLIRIPVDQKFIDLSHQLCDEFQDWATLRNPDIVDLSDDEEIWQLQDLLIILRLGYLKMYSCECLDQDFLYLEIESI